jgi:glucose-1-phosphate thymidylyltransferase
MSKQMMPVYDKPMIYYCPSIWCWQELMKYWLLYQPSWFPNFKKLLGDGSDIGCKFAYAEQAVPNGLARPS